MKFKILNTLIAVLVMSTAIYTIFVFIPNTREEVVNTEVLAVVDNPTIETKSEIKIINPLEKIFSLDNNQTILYDFKLLNRNIPPRWKEKKIYLKTTYLGEYNESTLTELNQLLLTDYKWQRQLDANRDIVLGGPMFVKDNVYQLHTHNGLSLANKHYLFGDLLHLLYSQKELMGTKMEINNVALEVIWEEDMNVLEENITPPGADLIISTCLERNGDRRLVIGLKVIDN